MDNKSKPKPNKKKNNKQMIWSIKILVLSFALSICFGILSEMVLSGTGIIIAVLIIIVFVTISIIADMIGVGTTAANIQPFRAMASKKVRGAKEAIKLLLKADRVSSICCDVIGDVCGILSGAAGASIAVKVAVESNSALNIIIASLISAIVASLTIFGKSVCKKYAIDNSSKIVLVVGKVLSFFTPQNKSKTSKNKDDRKKIENNENTKDSNTKVVEQDSVIINSNDPKTEEDVSR